MEPSKKCPEATFSVLMSVYHKENAAFFDLSLSSILEHQTVLPTEFVLVCDGSLNEELDGVIEKYQKAYPEILKVYRTSTNQGLGKALNFGLEKCSYDLVARADSDDICVEDRFEIQLNYMKAHPDVSIVSSYIDEFDVDWTKPDKKKESAAKHGFYQFRKSDLVKKPVIVEDSLSNTGSKKGIQEDVLTKGFEYVHPISKN